MIADGFYFLLLFWREKKILSYCLLLWIHFLIIKILPVTVILFKELVAAYVSSHMNLELFRKPPVILKMFRKLFIYYNHIQGP
jgi:hypothetical protein